MRGSGAPLRRSLNWRSSHPAPNIAPPDQDPAIGLRPLATVLLETVLLASRLLRRVWHVLVGNRDTLRRIPRRNGNASESILPNSARLSHAQEGECVALCSNHERHARVRSQVPDKAKELKGILSGNITADNEGVDLVGTLIGIHGF